MTELNLEANNTPRMGIQIAYKRTCDCKPNHINCLTAKEWLKHQIGVWQFTYEKRDIRNKQLHPATFPIALAKRCIALYSHQGELIVDPFVGSGTTLIAARDLGRNAVGFDLKQKYIELSQSRLDQEPMNGNYKQIAICDDARNIPQHFESGTISLCFTSPPYANMLNRKRKNKSRRANARNNEQYMKIEQYSQDARDLGTLSIDTYKIAMEEIYTNIFQLIKPGGHCVVNSTDIWWNDKRLLIHKVVIEALEQAGFEFRNTIIWDRTNIVNNVGIFGWPSNYITIGTTFEYLLHFRRPKS